ncbi:hypothetical protein HPB49_025444 [Dermacentor silvarum]|uniref:Uncharacterized protein n=1 Tax=Dermacentor silvarum TaxID=543639 RepID=A0ACB8C6D5_DERSI|nr:hypothetical protein HPB49_025444 [Dermacentor silvarum]
MPCTMANHFKWYGLLCLLSGTLYVRGLQRGPARAVVSLKSWYTLYASCCVLALYAGEFAYILKGSRSEFQGSQLSTKISYVLIYGFAQLKVAVNIATSAFKASELLEFFRAAQRFERDSGFRPSRESFAMSKVFLVFRTVMAAMYCGAAAMTFVFLADHYNEMPSLASSVFLKTLTVLDLLLYIPHDTVYSIAMRPCCEVLVAYIRAQYEELTLVAKKTDPLSRMQTVRRLEMVRLNLCAVRDLKRRLERVWKWPLLLAGASVLLSMSVDAAAAFYKAVSREGIFLSAVFSAYQAVDFADLSMLSQAMINEASHLKAVLKTMVIRDSPECYINQVRFLYDAVQPPDMGLKCGNFFKLDTPLVVTMAGAIITFAVILVQTVDQARN